MTTDETSTAVATRDWESVSAAEVIERVVIGGDLGALSPDQRVAYYARVCESLGLNPFTRPFDYIRLNNKLTLYAKRDATDQIRRNLKVNVTAVDPAPPVDGLYGLIAHVRTPDGREDTGTAYVNVRGLAGENLANALMKCETKAKRRATLSIAGLGIIDESEVSSIPDGELVAVSDDGTIRPGPTSISDVIAARVASLSASEPVEPVAETVPETVPEPSAGASAAESTDDPEDDGSSVPVETAPEIASETVIAVLPTILDQGVGEVTSLGTGVRLMDLNAFAAYVANVGVPRDEMREVAARLFPEATGFRMLSDEQRGAIADELDRIVAERATDDDGEEDPADVEGLPQDAISVDLCGNVSPFGETICDREPGHPGAHRSGNNESW